MAGTEEWTTLLEDWLESSSRLSDSITALINGNPPTEEEEDEACDAAKAAHVLAAAAEILLCNNPGP